MLMVGQSLYQKVAKINDQFDIVSTIYDIFFCFVRAIKNVASINNSLLNN